ncbi:MAG: LITAF-like zinc ribbon domain-containing protein [Bacteroidetes bacterium]|nr:LITAF-like zinc ribbon domain-containing protein [Bacteroidota bacterium]
METDIKPTPQKLAEYYHTNRQYFDELAKYYFEHDKEFYQINIYPLYSTLSQGQITCPFCKQNVFPLRWSKTSTSGIIMIVVGLIFTPVLIGILFIYLGTTMKDYTSVCPNCKCKLG